MTFLSAFVLSFGTMLALTAIVAAWLFRTTPAPLWVKLIVPAALVSLACYAPGTVSAMLGLPVMVTFDELPQTRRAGRLRSP
jgi:ribose/xylose/arabinose/galactoside ABC-type transport system permease subunit